MAEADEVHTTEENQHVEHLQPEHEQASTLRTVYPCSTALHIAMPTFAAYAACMQADQHQEEPPKDEGVPDAVDQAAGEAAQPEHAATDAAADEGMKAAEDKAGSPTAAVAEPIKEASEQDHVAAAVEDAVEHKAAHAEVQHTAPAHVVHQADEEQQQQHEELAAEQQQYVHEQHNTSPTHVQQSKKAHSVAASHCGPFSQRAADGRLLSFSAPPYVPKVSCPDKAACRG
jgi:hypothetical protein